jgi:CelD/BcsL family acetyltransferase involved in cellulose biosynthesis
MITVQVSEVTDFAALGQRWLDLERRAVCSFFQSWAWTGCLAAERFPDPVLVAATQFGRTVALALFNRARGRLYLGESGDPTRDTPYIEGNAVLTEGGRERELTEACLRVAARSRGVVLSGVSEVTLHAASRSAGMVWTRKANDAPFVDLRHTGPDYLATRSANTRQQIRRSDRVYGEPAAIRATTTGEAHAMLDAMAVLHQASWTARGQPGCFAKPFFGRFHHALIEAAFPTGNISMTEVSSAGFLYNFVFRGRVSAYQSGFDYATAGQHGKPGLTCHHAAISDAHTQGHLFYDFLAGDDRYKRSLANASSRTYWVEAGPAWSPRLLTHCLRDRLFPHRRDGRRPALHPDP